MKRLGAVLILLLLFALPLAGDNRVKTWVSGEALTASDLNAEFNNIYGNVTHTISGTWTFDKAGTPITITPASAPAANTVLLAINNTSSTNLWKIDYEGDITRAGTTTWTIDDATTNATTTFATISHTSTGTAAVGLGIRWIYQLENASGTNTAAAHFDVLWSDATAATEDADFAIRLIRNGAMEDKFKFLSTGNLEFEGATADAFETTFAITDPTADRTITFQDVTGTVYVSNGTDVALADGGTNATLTANNGGIVYSTATAMAILAGTATAGQILRSGASTTPSWSTATYPVTATASGTFMRADGTNWSGSTLVLPNAATANRIVYATSANTLGESANLTYDGTSFAVGGAITSNAGILFTGTFSPSTTGRGLQVDTTVNATAGNDAYLIQTSGTIVEAGSSTHGVLSLFEVAGSFTNGAAGTTDAVKVNITTFTAPTGTTNATGLRAAAPTGATNNYAINVTTGDIYKAGTAYNNPGWVLEHFYTGQIKLFADKFGATGYEGLLPLEDAERFVREHYELPQMARFKKGGYFDRGDMLLASVEQNFLYITKLNARIVDLESRLARLETGGDR